MDGTTANVSTASASSSDNTAVQAKKGDWISKLPTPLTTTMLAGVLAVAASVTGAILQGRDSLQLEREKQQHDLVLKMISIGDLKQAKENLQFLAESGLIADQKLAGKILGAKASPVLPRPSGSDAGKPCGPNDVGVMSMDGTCLLAH
jgi:hypothetical protein